MKLDLSIWTAEKACALAIVVCSLTLPRSPAVYKDGRLVDHQSGTSIISLLSFSWYPLYRPEFLELESISLRALPILPLSQRMRTARRNFMQCASGDKLLSQLMWTWRHSLFLQWSLTLLHSASQFAGQYLLQRLLGSLERPFAQQQYAMAYALSLGLALLLENMSAGWTTWVTQAKLTIPMTALLKGVLFENMTRRRSSQQAAPQAAKRKDGLSLGGLMSNDW